MRSESRCLGAVEMICQLNTSSRTILGSTQAIVTITNSFLFISEAFHSIRLEFYPRMTHSSCRKDLTAYSAHL